MTASNLYYFGAACLTISVWAVNGWEYGVMMAGIAALIKAFIASVNWS